MTEPPQQPPPPPPACEKKGHHRRVSSYWIPSFAEQITSNPTSFFRSKDIEETRTIVPNPAEDFSRYQLPNYIKYRNNEISTTKYNPITFIPRNLWEQFHRLANIYFVFIIGVDCVPLWRTTPVYLCAIPVVFILLLTAVKDALEDMRRRRLDSMVNNSNCHVWDKNANRFRKMQWKHILVGDIVHISNDEFLPADILMLRTSSNDGNAFVETSNLDGESNLKHKVVPNIFLDYCGDEITLDDSFMRLKLASAPPSKAPDEMRGSMELDGRSETFSPANTLLRGSRLKNTTFVEGIVIYAGHDTKMMLSSGRAPYKRSHAEIRTNQFIIGCAAMLAVLIGITVLFRALWIGGYPEHDNNIPAFALVPPNSTTSNGAWRPPDWLSSIGSALVLYQIMIPLALYITVELIKLGQVFFMQQDVHMYCEEKDEAFVARSLSMGEELGQLTHLLSDKTGTLTQNKMILRRCATVESEAAVGNTSCSFPDADVDFRHLLYNMIACNTVFVQFEKRRDVIDDQDTPSVNDVYSVGTPSSYAFSESELQEELGRRGLSAINYEGESPDELALVKGARRFGFHLTGRSSTSILYEDELGIEQKFEVLCTLPFDTVRKRMSVCIVGDDPNEVIIYSKGADSSMLGVKGKRVKRVSESALKSIEEDEEEGGEDDRPMKKSREDVIRSRVDEYARMGLRTLVMGMRVIKRSEFDEWLKTKNFVELSRGDDEDSENMIREITEKIETPTTPIGVTAVEDKLQDNVERSIIALREAKIQVWVLTGDKRETAEGVATACGLFRGMPVHFDEDSEESYAGEDVVVGPGQITRMCQAEFGSGMDRLNGCCSVLCYRLTPGQKAEIVKAVKRRGGVVAAIGDGANDVPMIQAAHVGIGISGNEGSQASMAADFVLAQFSFVARLILVHGHWNYARIASVMLYFFYKNIQNVMISFFIQIFNGWSCGFPVNMMYSVTYPIIFTSLQPILYGVMDKDHDEKELTANPTLYEAGRDGELYNVKLFLSTIVDSIWQAAVCYFTAQALATDTPHTTQYLGFCLASAMFVCNMGHLIMDTKCLNVLMIAIHVIGFIVTFGFFPLYDLLPTDELFVSEDAMTTFPFYAGMLLAVIVALTPRALIRIAFNADAEAGQRLVEDTSELSVL